MGRVEEQEERQLEVHALRFSSEAQTCMICFDDVAAAGAVRLECTHGWYCTLCMQRHADARLEAGGLNVPCPECQTPVAEFDLRKLLPAETVERLLQRSLEHAIASVSDLWACPTPGCPMRVALADGEIPRLKCSACKKESCMRCGAQPYHKGVTCEKYAERKNKRGLQKDDDKLFQQWIEETGSKQCPTCRMVITKLDLDNQGTQLAECHKMLCRNCNSRFCFKCLAVLTDTYTCGCSIDAHGFCDPLTGKRVEHLRKGRGRHTAAGAASGRRGRGRARK